MKVLQLCKKFPFPLKDGESIAITYLSRAMVNLGCEVTLLSMNTVKHYVPIETLPEDYDHYKNIYEVMADNSIRPLDALKNLFTNSSYHIDRFISDDFKKKLIEILSNEKFDVIQLETLYLAPYIDLIKKYSNALITMRSHNIEYEIWERITNNTNFLPKKWYLQYLTKKLKNFELNRLNDYDYLIAVSERDLQKFKKLGYKNGAMASPIGLELKNYISINKQQEESICFIGALDWVPNQEGLDWFIKNVWSELNTERPNLKFYVAGRNTSSELLKTKISNVIFMGEVPNAIEFINNHSIMIVPLFSGSGMRVKILEGMALKKTIVTTTLGKEGIDAVHGENILVADNPTNFKNAIITALNDSDLRSKIGEHAFNYVKEYYDHSNIAQKLVDKYKQLIENPHHH